MIEDGLKVFLREFSLSQITSLIERTALWVAPETFRLLPVWYPEHARRWPFYKSNWSVPLTNTNRRTKITIHKFEGNLFANDALSRALGLQKANRPNWTCCHLWGVDDPTYQKANDVVANHRYYSCVGNMVLLPTPLKAFTDVVPEVKAMLRLCATNLYGWQCDHESMADTNAALNTWSDWSAYPVSWPRRFDDGRRPIGLVALTSAIRSQADRRLEKIRLDLKNAGPFYPRDQVLDALAYWKISETGSPLRSH